MKIGILSRNRNLYSTRRLHDEGVERGHEVHILDHYRCYVVLEKGNPTVHYRGEELRGYDAIIPRIGASATFYGTAIVRQFEMMKVFSANDSQAIIRSRDKLRSMQLLSRAGLGMPITGFAHMPGDKSDLIAKVGGAPLVLKLLEGTQGMGVVLAETKKAAESVLDAFYNLDTNLLIQEFIAEARGADIRAFVVDGHVVGAMRRQGREGEFRSNLHRGGTASTIELSREERYTALKAAKVLGLRIAGVDMLQSDRGPLIMEVNSSPGLEGIERATGENIAGRIYDFIEEGTSRKGKKAKKKDEG